MQLIRQIQEKIRQLRRNHLDPSSLQFRLTIEIAALSILGLSSVAIWTSWKMQQILIATHTQNVEYIASRFPRDVQLYSEMLPIEAGLQKTINNVSVPGLLIWVKNPDGKLLAQSADFNSIFTAKAELMSLAEMPLQPQVYRAGDRYLVLYQGTVAVKGTRLGKVYMAQDITAGQHELMTAIQSLALVCTISTVVMMIAISLRIRRALQPLHEMSQMAGIISAEDLGEAKLQLRHAPSEVKELANTFNMMLSRLSESWEQQRQFVSNVSHELRTPLTVVSGYLQSLLRRSNNLTDYQREALETASSEADRTIHLLQDLLDLARADSGYVQFNLESITLNDLLIEVAEMSEKFSSRAIILNAERSIKAIADRSRLKRILINLIDNAVKYSEPDQPITLTLEQTDQQALIQVHDRGVGIPLHDQTRIFERFYRVDESRARFPLRGSVEQSSGGYGLGLAIVKTLVEGMNGSIHVRSKLGEGSTFTVALPRS
ncbi:HAMP domain-containing protein [Phormidesmis priestleyi ULC007]|uniref:histidine kinase n=1 Tax=Phormidesmis priestleyi ULC007 TaxID=1920490 RepID=A0A2T1D969_9CYAN|nr:ATP-binding protein [Phormidesmis priestleyi]PSB16991.1 HAMP domain-containing protein [Phormidesmis priestleyi ULC007]PZO47900.1 MAG: HAMP domain-containing protein [Phormidesmis priestleyi]